MLTQRILALAGALAVALTIAGATAAEAREPAARIIAAGAVSPAFR